MDSVRRDHVLNLPEGCTVADLAAAVDTTAPGDPATAGDPGGAPDADGLEEFLSGGAAGPARPLFLDGAPVDPAAPVRGSGIREGGVLGLGGPVPDPDPAAGRAAAPPGEPVIAEVHAVSGPGAGRSWRLPRGGYEIGSDPGCAIRVSGPRAPESGVWVTVAADGTAYWHDERPPDGREGVVRLCEPVPPPDIDPITGAAPDRTSPEERLELVREAAELAELRERELAGRPEPLPGTTAWPHDVDLAVGGTLLRVVAPVLPDAAVVPSEDGVGLDYNRPPRIAPHLDAERLRLPSPPGSQQRPPFPVLVMIAPVVVGLLLAGVLRSYFYLVFIVFTPIMVLSNWVSGRRSNRRDRKEERRRYRSRRRVVEREIRDAVVRERWVRCVTGPDPAAAGLIAAGPGARLWERRRGDPDHLVLRAGTVDLPSVKDIDDPAQDENHRVVRWTLPDIPIGVEVAEFGVVGVAGPAAPVRSLGRWFLAQAAVLHSPRDLRAVVLTVGDPRAGEWGWARWLPHLRPSAPGGPVVAVGNDAESVASRVSELVSEIRKRRQMLESSSGRAMLGEPDILVIVDGARRLRDVPGMVRVLTEGPAVRIFCVCLDEEERLLPEECNAVLALRGGELTIRQTGVPDTERVRADLVSAAWCERVARSLAPLRDVSPQEDGGMPDESRLLTLIGQEPPDARALADRWRRRPASTTFPLGVGLDGTMTLDLVRDGPHGLVAGTTGSGKSELLRAFVASLAAVNRPDELTFVLVDYKGGSAFRECADLPHTLGMITDLDGHLVRRALDSLGAELRRRERVLAEHDAKDHPEYRAKRAADPALPPLPRLVLIIDEFATLIRETPDFVTGMIGIAQRGRSLGIHLVLATQRPAGVVTPDIKANTNLRVALRVTDAAESQDIIDTNDAAMISTATPGRAMVRQGPRMSVPFQSAWVGAERPGASAGRGPAARGQVHAADLPWSRLGRPAPDPSPGDDMVETLGPPAPTDLQALVEAVQEATELIGDHEPQPSPWLPPLPEKVVLDELPEVRRPPERDDPSLPALIPYAMEDLPLIQERSVAAIDLASFGHLYVIGAPRSGRTQVLRTIAGSAAREVSAADLHIYGIDAAGGGLAALRPLPHCGAIAGRYDMEQLDRMITRLATELTRRQELCAARHCSGVVELRSRLPEKERPAHILLFIDGWDALVPVLDDYDGGRLFDDVNRLLREGAAGGVHVVATSERSLLAGRTAAHNDHKLMLRQADSGDYTLLGMLPSQVPTMVPDGRGWHTVTRTETQVVVLADDQSGQGQAAALREIAAAATKRDGAIARNRRPFTVESLPQKVDFAEVYDRVPGELRRPLWGLLGVGGDDAGPVGVDFATPAPTFLVAGPPGSGRSNTLACLAVSLLAGGASLVVLTPRDSPLRSLAAHPGARVLADPDPSEDEVREAIDAMPGPGVVLVDDADMLSMGYAEQVLKETILSARERSRGLVAAGPAESLGMGMSSWVSAAKRSRKGLLLAPQNLAEGDLIGARLSLTTVRSHAPLGRAWTSGPAGTAMSVQVPLTPLKTS
ncbi:FtsK/SpoIIIE domain-containing protein [Actinomadura meridiana]|uniref:FtsK/SpoIIIE domain-containing protein n=1 Tax=Actinomadura meridiana TaxID=559626 RepID=A0ABP8C8A4_9ACTN